MRQEAESLHTGRMRRRDIIQSMDTVKPKFVVSADGRKQGVVLVLRDYLRLMRRLEDLEDALALDRAEESSKKLLAYSSVRRRLARAHKL